MTGTTSDPRRTVGLLSTVAGACDAGLVAIAVLIGLTPYEDVNAVLIGVLAIGGTIAAFVLCRRAVRPLFEWSWLGSDWRYVAVVALLVAVNVLALLIARSGMQEMTVQ
jgi:hypothetical protein